MFAQFFSIYNVVRTLGKLAVISILALGITGCAVRVDGVVPFEAGYYGYHSGISVYYPGVYRRGGAVWRGRRCR